ncbi:MAG: carboxypeptidase regulatory-like domain-containing protein, partial [Bacteroidetes bacterium]|nr:carboxypeptidase regulatory-like domain-containing protein [Bacteroidota bacterium]
MKKIILSALCLITLASCKKEAVEGPQGPAGTNGTNGTNGTGTTGTITGKIKQFDQYGTPYTTGLNTTTISVESTTNSATTDAVGNFTIANLPPGIYDLAISKPNCGLRKYQQITFPGNGTLYIDDDISDKATFTFVNGYVKDTTIGSVTSIK